MYSLKGFLKKKMDTQQISEKFQKREFVITDNSSQYPQDIIFQLVQDKVSLIETANEGDEITVHFNLRGREWTSPKDGQVKYFNSLDAWKIDQEAASPLAQSDDPGATEDSFLPDQEDDDLPF